MQIPIIDSKKPFSDISEVAKIISLIVGEAAIMILGGVILRITMTPDIIVGVYIDGLSLLPMIGMMLIVLVTSGMLKDFGRAFVYCVKDVQRTAAEQLKRAAYAVKLSMVTALLTGMLMTMLAAISILYSPMMQEPRVAPVLFASSLIGLLYGIIVAILMIPIYARLRAKIVAME